MIGCFNAIILLFLSNVIALTNKTMKNPWIHLTNKPPFVLLEDKSFLDSFNSRYQGTDKEIMLDQIPSPYIGDPKASIILLNLNPGYDREENNNESFSRIARANFLHEFFDYPFYPLDPRLKGTPSGYEWWKRILTPLMHATGLDEISLSKKIFCVEYFPYHSVKYGYGSRTLLSREYGGYLIESALTRGVLVIIMRGEGDWKATVPQLGKHSEQVFVLHSPQNVVISENNLGKEAFDLVVEKLQGGKE